MIVYNNNSGSTGRNTATSKGNQLKFCIDNNWYKADFLGYEGASEYLASEILKNTNIKSFVQYNLTTINYNDKVLNGCVSGNFLKEGESLITAERLIKAHTNKTTSELLHNCSLQDKIKIFVDNVIKITNLPDFGAYLTTLLEFDKLILNEDRHFHNIAIIKTQEGYKYCPIFDNGAAFLSDLREDYPLEKNIHGLIPKVKAKPFNTNFDTQVSAAESLYGKQLSLSDMDLDYAFQKINECYGDIIASRMQNIFDHQLFLLEDEYLSPNKAFDLDF